MTRRHQTWAAAAGALLLAAMTGCSGASLGDDTDDAGDTIKIGLIADLSGAQKPVGEDMRRGVELYLAENDNKLGGRDTELIVVDEGQTADTAHAATEKLLKKDQVDAIVGVTQAANVASLQPQLARAEVPLVGSLGWPANLKSYDWIWSTSWLSAEIGESLGPYVAEKIGKEGTAFVVAAGNQGGRDQAEAFVRSFEKAGGTLANEDGKATYSPWPPEQNFTPYLSMIKNSGADAVFCFYVGSSAVNFMQQYRQLDIKAKLYASPGLTEGSVLKAHGKRAMGVLTTMNYAANLDNVQNREFVAAFTKAHPGVLVSAYAMTSWDSMNVLDQAIGEIDGAVTSKKINEAISGLGRIDSPRGRWDFGDKYHTPVQQWYLRRVDYDGSILNNVLVEQLGTLGG